MEPYAKRMPKPNLIDGELLPSDVDLQDSDVSPQ